MSAYDGYVIDVGDNYSTEYIIVTANASDGSLGAADEYYNPGYITVAASDSYNLAISNGLQSQLIYIMRAIDDNDMGSELKYRTWYVKNEPDFEVKRYSGEYSGSEINFINIVVINKESI